MTYLARIGDQEAGMFGDKRFWTMSFLMLCTLNSSIYARSEKKIRHAKDKKQRKTNINKIK
jgi:hypothetical protein